MASTGRARKWVRRSARGINDTVERSLGLRVIRTSQREDETTGMEPEALAAMANVDGRTMADTIQQYVAYSAARYVARSGIEGAIVECGVWRGGATMLMIQGLLVEEPPARPVMLFDTFEGMTPPDGRDRALSSGDSARKLLSSSDREPEQTGRWNVWCNADEADVRAGVAATGYPSELVHFVRGPVETTLAAHAPESVAIARLDTDWYASTKVEMEVLFDRIVAGGVLILDDYDDWSGARQAVDEFFAARKQHPFLVRAGRGRVYVKSRS